jgi:hypothetical protein
MSATTRIRDFLNKLASTLASRRRSADFVCADCKRWARCGMPSSDNCIYRAEEIARGDWRVRRRVKSIESSNGLADAVDLALIKSKRCVSWPRNS